MIASLKVVEEEAMRILTQVEPRAIHHLIETLNAGTFDARQHGTCFFGTIARGSGYVFDNPKRATRTLAQFKRILHVEQASSELRPIEQFCLSITPGEIPAINAYAHQVVKWCQEALSLHEQRAARATEPRIRYSKRHHTALA